MQQYSLQHNAAGNDYGSGATLPALSVQKSPSGRDCGAALSRQKRPTHFHHFYVGNACKSRVLTRASSPAGRHSLLSRFSADSRAAFVAAGQVRKTAVAKCRGWCNCIGRQSLRTENQRDKSIHKNCRFLADLRDRSVSLVRIGAFDVIGINRRRNVVVRGARLYRRIRIVCARQQRRIQQ